METEGKERCSTRSDIQSGPEGVRAVLRGMQMAQSIFYMDALRSAALPCIQENSGLSPRFSLYVVQSAVRFGQSQRVVILYALWKICQAFRRIASRIC